MVTVRNMMNISNGCNEREDNKKGDVNENNNSTASSLSQGRTQDQMLRRRWIWLASYLVFGAFHESAHIMTAKVLGYQIVGDDDRMTTSIIPALFGMLLGRTAIIPSLERADEFDVAIVRHAGWVVSLILYLSICLIVSHMSKRRSESRSTRDSSAIDTDEGHTSTFLLPPSFSFLKDIQDAALVTLLEAVTTDLAGFSISGSKTMFCCGNFGVIILNNAWVQTPGDNGKTVLDLLEKMISITMMRGGECAT